MTGKNTISAMQSLRLGKMPMSGVVASLHKSWGSIRTLYRDIASLLMIEGEPVSGSRSSVRILSSG
jgi:hypothetical protein